MNNSFIVKIMFLLLIVILISLPFIWKSYGKKATNDFIYREYSTSDLVDINTDDTLDADLYITSIEETEMYMHIVYTDFSKEISSYPLSSGENIINFNMKSKDVYNIYIYIDGSTEYWWKVFD